MLGTIAIENVNFVRPFDAGATCTTFEVQDRSVDRVFQFEASSHGEMLRWVGVINKVLNAYRERRQQELEERIAKETPERVKKFEEFGGDAHEFMDYIEEELRETVYPTMEMVPKGGTSFSTLKEHLDCATEVVNYLHEVVAEIQCVGVEKTTR